MSRTERKKNLIGAVLLALVVVLLGVLIFQNVQAAAERDTAQTSAATSAQQKKNLAEEVADACESGQVVKSVAGVDLCQRAANIAQQPTTVEGPAGPRGLPGADGKDGKNSTVPGPEGPAGVDGKDSTVPGPQGATGLTGMTGASGVDGVAGTGSEAPGPIGPPGPAGAESTVPGPAGPAGQDGASIVGPAGPAGKDGLDGAQGRGIASATCGDDANWQITYSDGTTFNAGKCRDPALPPEITPTPTAP